MTAKPVSDDMRPDKDGHRLTVVGHRSVGGRFPELPSCVPRPFASGLPQRPFRGPRVGSPPKFTPVSFGFPPPRPRGGDPVAPGNFAQRPAALRNRLPNDRYPMTVREQDSFRWSVVGDRSSSRGLAARGARPEESGNCLASGRAPPPERSAGGGGRPVASPQIPARNANFPRTYSWNFPLTKAASPSCPGPCLAPSFLAITPFLSEGLTSARTGVY